MLDPNYFFDPEKMTPIPKQSVLKRNMKKVEECQHGNIFAATLTLNHGALPETGAPHVWAHHRTNTGAFFLAVCCAIKPEGPKK